MKKLTTLLAALGLVALTSSAALAAGGGFQFDVHGYYIIDFIVFVAILYFLARKPVAAFLEKRHENAKAEMGAASAARDRAKERIDKYEGLLAGLEDEIARIRGEFKADGERQREKILADALRTSDKLKADTELRIRQETAQARQDLEHEITEAVVTKAEEKLRKQMTPDKQHQLIKAYIQQLENLKELKIAS